VWRGLKLDIPPPVHNDIIDRCILD